MTAEENELKKLALFCKGISNIIGYKTTNQWFYYKRSLWTLKHKYDALKEQILAEKDMAKYFYNAGYERGTFEYYWDQYITDTSGPKKRKSITQVNANELGTRETWKKRR